MRLGAGYEEERRRRKKVKNSKITPSFTKEQLESILEKKLEQKLAPIKKSFEELQKLVVFTSSQYEDLLCRITSCERENSMLKDILFSILPSCPLLRFGLTHTTSYVLNPRTSLPCWQRRPWIRNTTESACYRSCSRHLRCLACT